MSAPEIELDTLADVELSKLRNQQQRNLPTRITRVTIMNVARLSTQRDKRHHRTESLLQLLPILHNSTVSRFHQHSLTRHEMNGTVMQKTNGGN